MFFIRYFVFFHDNSLTLWYEGSALLQVLMWKNVFRIMGWISRIITLETTPFLAGTGSADDDKGEIALPVLVSLLGL